MPGQGEETQAGADRAREVLRLERLEAPALLRPLSFGLEAGSSAAVLTSSEEANGALARLLIGVQRPRSGSVALFGKALAGLQEKELWAVRRRVGVVYCTGGLVSNLKLWENLTLPLAYQGRVERSELERRGREILARLGYGGRLMASPSALSRHERMLVGMGRAMLCAPELMIYELPLQYLSHGEGDRVLAVAREFQAERPGRASLFITSQPEGALAAKVGRVFFA